MKNIILQLFIACTVFASSNLDLVISPSSLSLALKPGKLERKFIEIQNTSDSPLNLEVDYDNRWMHVAENRIAIESHSSQKLLAFFFMPNGKRPADEGKITLNVQGTNQQIDVPISVEPEIDENAINQLVARIDEMEKANPASTEPDTSVVIESFDDIFKPVSETSEPAETTVLALNDNTARVNTIADSKTISSEQNSNSRQNYQERDVVSQEELPKPKPFKTLITPNMLDDGPADQPHVKNLDRTPYRYLYESTNPKRNVEKLTSLYEKFGTALAEEIESGCVDLTWFKDRILLTICGDKSFKPGVAVMQRKGAEVIKKVATVLYKNSDKNIRIIVSGHSDNTPVQKHKDIFESNWELSSVRAATVVRRLQYLTDWDGQLIHVNAGSHYYPIAPNETRDGRAQNRRVELLLNWVED